MIKLLGRIHSSQSDTATFTRFATVAVTVSLIDAGVLYAFMALGWNAHIARAFSLTTAMTAGYFLHRNFTFHHMETRRALWHSLLRHLSVNSIGASLNIAMFSLVLILGEHLGGKTTASATLPLFGVWIGGITGMCFNFFFSRKLVFDN